MFNRLERALMDSKPRYPLGGGEGPGNFGWGSCCKRLFGSVLVSGASAAKCAGMKSCLFPGKPG